MTTMTPAVLARENEVFCGSGAVSSENRSLGFVPAFRDTETGVVYRSHFMDGRPAPMHLLDGLPESVVLARSAEGRVLRVKASIVSGFLLCGAFFTRQEATRQVEAMSACPLAA